jgi:predicted glycosyltransferase involved in capsule biosynthesis
MSFWKSDLLLVNGYNEDIQGWGSEDAELAIRLINKGVKKRFLKFSAVAYHLYHKENSKANLLENEKILNLTIQNKTIWAENGIQKHRNS